MESQSDLMDKMKQEMRTLATERNNAVLDAKLMRDGTEALLAEVKDAEILFGAGWQESLKAVNGNTHEAAHAQCVKLAGDVAILQELVDGFMQATDTIAAGSGWFDDEFAAIREMRKKVTLWRTMGAGL